MFAYGFTIYTQEEPSEVQNLMIKYASMMTLRTFAYIL